MKYIKKGLTFATSQDLIYQECLILFNRQKIMEGPRGDFKEYEKSIYLPIRLQSFELKSPNKTVYHEHYLFFKEYYEYDFNWFGKKLQETYVNME